MKKKTLFLLCFCFYGVCYSQSGSLSVVGTAGESFRSPEGSLDWTLGEIMTETYIQKDRILTQGFHQPEIKTVDLEQSIIVYPNPVSDSLNVRLIKNGSYQVEVYTMLGNKLIDQNINLTLNNLSFQIDFREFGPALYVLRIFNIKTGQVSSFKIEKI
jgi:hypothetical protein